MTRTTDDALVKVLFRLNRDPDGYPPVDVESVWAIRQPDGSYKIDNIPFYARGVAVGDTVTVNEIDGELFFAALARPSGNSLIRAIVYDEAEVSKLCVELKALGCDVEVYGRFVAVDVPASISYAPICQLLEEGMSAERLGFEEAVLCHKVSADDKPPT
jgi:hypothetical protein